ncbi:aspartic peptidase domain-containing protein [Lophiotrema nucula]|uniref:Aspartic peptidase domain-containing protein n=1 Tax=Lophiotrema nucula TaxID=690887 RepID=A0A6A5YRB5_9PLEO|nr:aspartic peptidase domain-containing protein [Lophiotrema nucula]
MTGLLRLHQIVALGTTIPYAASAPLQVPLYNDLAYQRYLINVTVGAPPQHFPLMFDTGSTDVYFPLPNSSGCVPNCPTGFDPSTSSTIVDTHTLFNASYGFTPDLQIIGDYYNDTVTVGWKKMKSVQFAAADVPSVFFSVGQWGIFGASSRLKETVVVTPSSPSFQNASATYTPLWERLSPSKAFSVWLNKQNAKKGSVAFGVTEPDPSKFTGKLRSVPLNTQGSDRLFIDWNVNLTSVTRVDSDGTETPLTAANFSTDFTFDTGSPNMYLPSALYSAIVDPLNPILVNNTPYVACSLRSSFTSYLEFRFPSSNVDEAGIAIRVPYAEIIYPFAYPSTVEPVRDGNGSKMCYFGALPNDGPIRLLGATFLRSAYLIFDEKNLSIKMAQAQWKV